MRLIIRPYRGDHDNDPKNGLLLRTDLHTLFDLNLLGIKPDTLTVIIHRRETRTCSWSPDDLVANQCVDQVAAVG
jgi:HNH endonuclease